MGNSICNKDKWSTAPALEELTVQVEEIRYMILYNDYFIDVDKGNIYEVLWGYRLKVIFFQLIIALFQTLFYSNYSK